ncbi:Alpha-ketoglutarate-dependent taurine dioxygenase [Cupriavidus necator]|uniref:Taurine catabolism dioxygenase n=1 Tax=Cupriavidus necator (strain ATCC 17699 / DSM 428 / KCTC 22496 / NCIMB 10442 / H16 / Stanier 337) TaxID=381666 RepID=Q0K454_CUPNH|nr:TauD/TfdA family dioxygenase [Cupriavidus necator]QCC03141.1 taurine dioxygenase [Cupriavidus necator H16]QQB80198.1 TauD/TfdA family dioxygenase [Cupriavidus necator]WKA44464.1 TauD/TfdA family dioxygenase [Cupriavidus necator]CAJ95220.1 taurine catabolism dioxygenase [Cupriavidus necator H16]
MRTASPESPTVSTPAVVRPNALHASFTVSRISPALGAEVGSIDLAAPLDDDTISALRRALVEHKVLVFRDQDITPAQHVALARRFGELEVHPAFPHHEQFPELVLLGGDERKPAMENGYHSDVSWRELPSMGSMLRCAQCPEIGGDTVWVNMALAYERLPDHRKQQIEGLLAVHDIGPAFGDKMTPEQQRQFPPVAHPVVRTHPESGEKILYVNSGFVTHFANFKSRNPLRGAFESQSEKQDLLDYLFRQPAILEYQMRLRWRPNTIAFWDNRSTQHYAIQDYFPAVRRMMRATIIGDRPV